MSSHTPDNQRLAEPIEAILKGIDDFNSAVDERIKSDDWLESHIRELIKISNKLTKLRTKLMLFQNRNI